MASKLNYYPEKSAGTYGFFTRIIGGFVLLQIGVVLWYVLFRFDGQLEVHTQSVAGSPPQKIDVTSPVTGGAGSDDLPSFQQAVGGTITPPLRDESAPQAPAPEAVASPTFIQAVNPMPEMPDLGPNQGPSPHRIENPAASRTVDLALRLREQGDTHGALTKLKEADSQVPNHPKILAEIATTYGQMGIEKKATEFWAAVHDMGIEGAGAYWDLADMALRGQQIMEGDSESDTVLRIVRHVALKDNKVSDGERVTLRVHLQAEGNGDQELRGEEMFMQVFFYDLVNEETFEKSIADAVPSYISSPYDWKDGAEEIIEVEYRLPELTEEQQAAFGQRTYYGYLIELYYEDVLQDVVANPRKLARKESQPAETESVPRDALFP